MSEIDQLVNGSAIFTQNLLKALLNNSENENIFFSPLSIHLILSLIYQGAKDETKEAIGKVLNSSSNNSKDVAIGYQEIMYPLNQLKKVTLHLANKIWLNDNFKLQNKIQNIAKNYFLAEIDKINFGERELTMKLINEWVEKKTDNKIQNLISEDMFDSDTSMVLVNATHFMGNWEEPFERRSTREADFYVSNEKVIKVNMMYSDDKFKCTYDSCLNANILELPYREKGARMIFILPRDNDGIKELEEKIVNIDDLTSVMRKKLNKRRVAIYIPKFKFQYKFDLKNTLKNMGLEIIFDDSANFDNFIENGKSEKIKVSHAIHKASVEVNEEGTVADAATGAMFRYVKGPPVFCADHPFIILIAYKDVLLFMGRIMEPLYE